MRYIASTIIMLLVSSAAFSQAPDWTDPVQRRSLYPESQYLTGFSSEIVKKTADPNELRRRHLGFAKTQLIETISVSIRSSATLNLENFNTKTLEQFKQASVSTSEAQLSGLKTETWYDIKKKSVYAFAYIRISDLIRSCKADLAEKRALLKQKYDAANNYSTSGDLELALKTYYQCFPFIREMENDAAMLVAIGKEPMEEQAENYELKINQAINNLRKERILTLDDVCLFIAEGLVQQIPGTDKAVGIQMGSFTYQDTRIGSEFSSRLSAGIGQKLIRQGMDLKSLEIQPSGNEKIDSNGTMVSGTYWEEGDHIKIIANLKSLKTNSFIAGTEEFQTKKWFTDNSITYLPANFQQALLRQKQFSENEIKSGGLVAEVWTNMGKDNPIFSKGDTMQLYIRVSQPCYIRMIYYFSDGSKSLLLDSRYIGDEQAGKPVLLPDLFVCDSPFGAETIQMVAQSSPFKPLTIKMENGYRMIVDDMNTILANVRGMKAVGSVQLMAEKRLDLTTIPGN